MSALDRLWFTRAPAARLALLRIVVGSFSLWYVGRRYRMLLRVAETDPGLFEPVGVARGLGRPLPPPVVKAAIIGTLIADGAFIAGYRHRYSGPAFSGLLLWTLSYRNSWSMIYHTDNTLVLHALILGLTPAADALSVDALRQGSIPALAAKGALAAEQRYGWPIQLMNTTTTLSYFVAGVAKVVGPLGKQWMSGDSLRGQIAVDALRKELLGEGAAPAAYALYNRPWIFRAMALGTMVVELAAPAAVASKRLGRLWAAAAFGMHWAILVVMRIKFRYQLSGAAFAPFFNLERLPGWLARR